MARPDHADKIARQFNRAWILPRTTAKLRPMSEEVQRRLAAIVLADVVGYSRLMGVDEVGTLNALRTHRKEFIDAKITQHGGRIVKTMGDGLLLEYPSDVAAVQCAVEVQEGMAARNEGVADDKRIVFRIGINVGDIIIEGDDVFGDGVNVAARLESLSEPGGICISGRVHDDVRGRIEAEFESLGEQELKNIARPVQAWRWTPDGAMEMPTIEPANREGLPLPDKPSIAVLAFNNLSGDPEQEYFADGIAEDITTGLSRLRWLFVIARNSSFAYKGESPDVRRVASELGVRYVLEGSVRKVDSRVRISAQLIEAASGNHVWAERYDREIADIFDVYDEITWNIVSALGIELTLAEIERSRKKRPETLDAWDLVMRAQPLINQFSQTGNVKAQELLREATVINPDDASAYAWLAYCVMIAGFFGWSKTPARSMAEALNIAQTAVENDRNDPIATRVLAVVLCLMSRQEEAIETANRALQLDPNCSIARGTLGLALSYTGRSDEAIEASQMALRASPRDPNRMFWYCNISNAYFAAGRLEEALKWGRISVQAGPGWFTFQLNIAFLAALLGHHDEAQKAARELMLLVPRFSIKRAMKNPLYTRPDDIARMAEGLRLAGLPE